MMAILAQTAIAIADAETYNLGEFIKENRQYDRDATISAYRDAAIEFHRRRRNRLSVAEFIVGGGLGIIALLNPQSGIGTITALGGIGSILLSTGPWICPDKQKAAGIRRQSSEEFAQAHSDADEQDSPVISRIAQRKLNRRFPRPNL